MIQMYNSIVDGWFILWFVKVIFFANIIPIIFGLVMFTIESIHYFISRDKEDWLFEGIFIHYLQFGCMIYFLYRTLPTLSELKYIYYENLSLIFLIGVTISISFWAILILFGLSYGNRGALFCFILNNGMILATFYFTSTEIFHFLLNI